MKRFILLILFSILLFSCSQTPMEAGDAAMQSGKYGEAIRNYNEALKAQPDDNAIKEKIATAFFKSGERIYKRRKVFSALEDRIERGMKALPDTLSADMKKYTVSVQVLMADAYSSAQPENDYQKKEYFDKALYYLENAVDMDPTDQNATEKLSAFKQKHFDAMLKKGERYFSRGKKDATNYLTAEYYLAKASDFDPENAKAKDLLRTVRKKTLNVLDPTQNYPLAITAELYQDGFQAKQIVVQNLSGKAIKISAASFFIVDRNGTAIQGSAPELFAETIQPATFKDQTEIVGVVAFQAKKRAKFTRLELREGIEVLSVKYLP